MIRGGVHSKAEEILTACYDGRIRVWDLRKIPARNGYIKEIDVAEQCWDFVPVEEAEGTIRVAAACIYSNAYMVKCGADWTLQGKRLFNGHKSIVYGVDVLPTGEVATCSFYDKRLCVWQAGL